MPTFFRDSRYNESMRDSRIGECLWREWTGDDYSPAKASSLIFFTDEHVDINNEVVRRALASALQRDGSVVSLGNGYTAVEHATTTQGYSGEVDGAIDLTVCDENGETRDGDIVDKIVPTTWVEIVVE